MRPEAQRSCSDDYPHSKSHTRCFTALHLLSAFWPHAKCSAMQAALLQPGRATNGQCLSKTKHPTCTHKHEQKQQRGSEWKGKTEESPACSARLRCPFKYPLLVPRFCSTVTAKSMSREKTDLKILVTSPRAIEAHDKIHHLTSTRYLLHSWLYIW